MYFKLLFNIIFVNAACARKNVLLNDVDVSHLVSAFKNIAKNTFSSHP